MCKLRFIIKTIFIIGSVFFISCSSYALTLSEEEAIAVINKDKQYPEIVHYFAEPYSNSFCGQKIKKLIADGRLVFDPDKKSTSANQYYKSTDDQLHIENVEFVKLSISDDKFYLRGSVTEQYVKKIKEILIDEENKTAKVFYITAYRGIEPAYSNLCENNCLGDYICNLAGPHFSEQEKTILLKKYDKGWRVQ